MRAKSEELSVEKYIKEVLIMEEKKFARNKGVIIVIKKKKKKSPKDESHSFNNS